MGAEDPFSVREQIRPVGPAAGGVDVRGLERGHGGEVLAGGDAEGGAIAAAFVAVSFDGDEEVELLANASTSF